MPRLRGGSGRFSPACDHIAFCRRLRSAVALQAHLQLEAEGIRDALAKSGGHPPNPPRVRAADSRRNRGQRLTGERTTADRRRTAPADSGGSRGGEDSRRNERYPCAVGIGFGRVQVQLYRAVRDAHHPTCPGESHWDGLKVWKRRLGPFDGLIWGGRAVCLRRRSPRS
jgi:hypothetical protein